MRKMGLWVAMLIMASGAAWAQTGATATPAPTQTPKAAETAAGKDFELPAFMRDEALAAAQKKVGDKKQDASKTESAAVAVNDREGDASDVVPNEGDYTNKMTVGDVIVSPRQRLLHQSVADIRMEEVPIRDALRYLAEAAGINYVLPDLETDKVTVNMHMPPFKAMEMLANNFGLGIYEEDGLWFIRKKDKAQYYAKIYRLHNIHLGESTSGAGVSNTTDENGNSTTSSTSTTTSSSSTTTSSSSSTAGSSTGGQVVMTTLQEILGINVDFGGTVNADGNVSTAEGAKQNESASNNSSNTTNADYTYVSYDADANTLFIIATATQHNWVAEYLKAIDNPTDNIAIEAMFLESSLTPSSQLGFDWEGASTLSLATTGELADGTSGSDGLPFGSIQKPKFPWTALIQSNNFSASLTAFQKQTDSQIAHYPSVVTQNGREVKIETTQNIPLSATQRLVSSDTQSSAAVGIQDLGTQKIGTTITITPRQINEKLVQLNISIKISTGTGSSDKNTNRVTTNDSTYTGTVNVPVGYTLAIGGLERVQDDVSEKKLPGVGDVPLFGFLFKSKGKNLSRTSIFLFITPTVLKTDGEANAFQRPSEGLSRDWVERADARHRAWRRTTIDPEMDKIIKDTGK